MHIRIMRCVKMLDVDKRDFIVLAVLVSPCVGFAVTGNTAGAKQVLRRPFLGGEGKPWVILEKRFLFYKPTSSGIPLWHVLIVFPSMACPKLWSGKFGCVFGCVWYVWSVHDECVFVLRAFVCCFFFARRDISDVFVSVRFLAAQPSRPIQPCHLECLGWDMDSQTCGCERRLGTEGIFKSTSLLKWDTLCSCHIPHSRDAL